MILIIILWLLGAIMFGANDTAVKRHSLSRASKVALCLMWPLFAVVYAISFLFVIPGEST